MESNGMIDISGWKDFAIGELFDVKKGKRLTKKEMKDGDINYVGASAFNNGITAHIANDEHIHPENVITVCYNGSVGQSFYQAEPFWASDDVNVLYPKFEMTKDIAMFMIPLIKAVGKNHEYMDKWELSEMKAETIPLPANGDAPDFKWIQTYMQEINRKAGDKLKHIASYY